MLRIGKHERQGNVRRSGKSETRILRRGLGETFHVHFERGELGGVLEIVLNRLAEFMEKAQKIKGKVVAAMFYPVAVIVVAICILGVLMVWVVPKFKDIFKDMLPGESLPAFTRFVLGVSDAISKHFIVSALVSTGLVVGLVLFIRTRLGRRLFGPQRAVGPGPGT